MHAPCQCSATMSLIAKLELTELVSRLSDSSGGSNGRGGGSSGGSSVGGSVTVDFGLSAVAGDVAGFTTAVAGLAGRVEWAAVGGGAVAGNVSQLSTGIALHSLSLAIAGKVVRTTTLVASSRASAASEAAPEASITAARSTGATTHSWVGAVAGKVTGNTAAVAASTGTSSTQAQSRAVSLDVSKALAVVALLSLGGTGMRASIGLVSGLLAVVAEPLRRRAHVGVVADVSALEARTTRQRRHVYLFLCISASFASSNSVTWVCGQSQNFRGAAVEG